MESGLPWTLLASGHPGQTMQGIIHKNTSAILKGFLSFTEKKAQTPSMWEYTC